MNISAQFHPDWDFFGSSRSNKKNKKKMVTMSSDLGSGTVSLYLIQN